MLIDVSHCHPLMELQMNIDPNKVTEPAELRNLIALVDLPNYLPLRRGRRVHIATIYRWARDRKIEVIRVGGVMYTDRASLQALLTPAAKLNTPVKSDAIIEAALRAKKLL